MTASQRLLTGVLSSWTGYAISAVTALVMAPFLVSRLGNEGYGLWSLYMAIAGYFTLLDFGVTPAIVRYSSRYLALGDAEAERAMMATGTAFFVAAGALVLVLTLVGAVTYDQIFPSPNLPSDAARMAFVMVGLDFAISLPCAVFQGALLGRQQYLALNGINILMRLARVACVFLWVGHGPTGLITVAAIFLATGIFRNLGLVLIGRRVLGSMPHWSHWRWEALTEMLRYSIPAFVLSVAFRVMSYTDSLVIGYTIGIGSVTLFALAASLTDYFQEVGWGLAGVLVPEASGQQARGESASIAERFLQFSRYCAWLAVPVTGLSVLLGLSFFNLWVGPEYRISADILVILILGMAFYVLQMPGQAILKGMGRHRPLAWLMSFEALLNLALSLFLATRMGVIGVALGTLLPRALIHGVFLPWIVLRTLHVPWLRYGTELAVAAFPGAVMLGGGVLFFGEGRPADLSWTGLLLAGSGCVGVAATVTLTVAATPEERQAVRSQAMRLLRAGGSRLGPTRWM